MELMENLKSTLAEEIYNGFYVFDDREAAREQWRQSGGNLFEVWQGDDTAWVVIYRPFSHLVDANWKNVFDSKKVYWIISDERGYNRPPFSFSFVTDYKYECEWTPFA